MELKPDWPKGYSRLGAAHSGLKQWDDAVEAYEKGAAWLSVARIIVNCLSHELRKRVNSCLSNVSFSNSVLARLLWRSHFGIAADCRTHCQMVAHLVHSVQKFGCVGLEVDTQQCSAQGRPSRPQSEVSPAAVAAEVLAACLGPSSWLVLR